MTPDHEQVSMLMKIWLEIKNTPPDVLIGFMAMVTVMAKLLGRAARRNVAYDPPVKTSQMDECKDEIIKHFDGKFNHFEKRIDELYKNNGRKQ